MKATPKIKLSFRATEKGRDANMFNFKFGRESTNV